MNWIGDKCNLVSMSNWNSSRYQKYVFPGKNLVKVDSKEQLMSIISLPYYSLIQFSGDELKNGIKHYILIRLLKDLNLNGCGCCQNFCHMPFFFFNILTFITIKDVDYIFIRT